VEALSLSQLCQLAACTSVQLHTFVTLNNNHSCCVLCVYRQLSRLLESGVTRGRAVQPRVEACRTLAIACFICSSEADVQDAAMSLLGAVFSR
jgi:hypothetical protein